MLGMETLPAMLFFAVIFMIPESPRWLIVKGNTTKAKGIYRHFFSQEEAIIRQIEETEMTVKTDVKSTWRSLMRPGIPKAILIGVCIAILGQFMGVNAVLYYGPSIFNEAGIGDPLFCQVLVGIVNTLTTIIAMFIIDRVGRKKLIYYGVTGMIACLLAISAYFMLRSS